MLLKNVSTLYSKNLDYIPSTNIRILDQSFQQINSHLKPQSKEKTFDCENLLLIPGLVNSHTHIGDSVAKDITLGGSVDSKIHPIVGIKQKILRETDPKILQKFMQKTCVSMIRKGITTFVDFREGGLEGVDLLKKVLTKLPIRSVILGRVEYYQDSKQIKKNYPLPETQQQELRVLLKTCDGLGVSGPNENSDSILNYYSEIKKIKAIHSAETVNSSKVSKNLTGISETKRALLLRPTFLVHMTYASKLDLKDASKIVRGIVVCPRANASLSEGIPDVSLMNEMKCNITLGTDNVMVNSPDIFREMDYIWKVTMGLKKQRFDPREILKMATVNAGKMLNRKIGAIQVGYLADGVFIDKQAIDLDPMENPYASVVQRVSESSIRAVMIGGKIVHGKI
jgi:cytosine/adenosine deaminase-related metal-dependent hydrolase